MLPIVLYIISAIIPLFLIGQLRLQDLLPVSFLLPGPFGPGRALPSPSYIPTKTISSVLHSFVPSQSVRNIYSLQGTDHVGGLYVYATDNIWSWKLGVSFEIPLLLALLGLLYVIGIWRLCQMSPAEKLERPFETVLFPDSARSDFFISTPVMTAYDAVSSVGLEYDGEFEALMDLDGGRISPIPSPRELNVVMTPASYDGEYEASMELDSGRNSPIKSPYELNIDSASYDGEYEASMELDSGRNSPIKSPYELNIDSASYDGEYEASMELDSGCNSPFKSPYQSNIVMTSASYDGEYEASMELDSGRNSPFKLPYESNIGTTSASYDGEYEVSMDLDSRCNTPIKFSHDSNIGATSPLYDGEYEASEDPDSGFNTSHCLSNDTTSIIWSPITHKLQLSDLPDNVTASDFLTLRELEAQSAIPDHVDLCKYETVQVRLHAHWCSLELKDIGKTIQDAIETISASRIKETN